MKPKEFLLNPWIPFRDSAVTAHRSGTERSTAAIRIMLAYPEYNGFHRSTLM